MLRASRAATSTAVLEAPTLVAGLDDVAVMREPVQQRRRHLGIDEDARPFAEGEVGRDDDGGALIEPADQMEQQLAARLRKREVAELVDDDQIDARQLLGETAGTAGLGLGFELVDQIHGIEEARLPPQSDATPGDADSDVALAGAGSPDRDHVALLRQEVAAGQIAYQLLVDRRIGKGEV